MGGVTVATAHYGEDMALSLPSQLVLLGHDAGGGAHGKSQNLDFGAAGAILVELALAGRIVVDGRQVAVVDATPTGDPLVDGALIMINSGRRQSPKAWVRKLGRGLRKRVLADLARSGVLAYERATTLWIFTYDRYTWPFGAEPGPRAEARTQCVRLISGAAAPDRRVVALCALVAAAGIDGRVFADLPRGQVRARLKELSAGDWAAVAVKKAIEEVQAAVLAAAVVASTAATTG